MNNKVKLCTQALGIAVLMCVVSAGSFVVPDQIEINCHQTPDLDCLPKTLADDASKSRSEDNQLSVNVIQDNADAQNVQGDIIADTTAKPSGVAGPSASIVPGSSLYKTKENLQRSPDLKRSSTTLPGPLLASIFALIGIVAVARRNVSGRGRMEQRSSSNSPKTEGTRIMKCIQTSIQIKMLNNHGSR
jgi:hypothetical protein